MKSTFAFLFVFLAVLALSYATPYNKYGRTCKDILCTVREECVMQRDECTGFSDKCGTYPTCKRKPSAGKTGCAAMKCPTGHFCSIRQENCDKPPCQIKPTCIAFRTPSPNRASNLPDTNATLTITTSTLTTTTETSTTIPVTLPTPNVTTACTFEPENTLTTYITTENTFTMCSTPEDSDSSTTISSFPYTDLFENTLTTSSDI